MNLHLDNEKEVSHANNLLCYGQIMVGKKKILMFAIQLEQQLFELKIQLEEELEKGK